MPTEHTFAQTLHKRYVVTCESPNIEGVMRLWSSSNLSVKTVCYPMVKRFPSKGGFRCEATRMSGVHPAKALERSVGSRLMQGRMPVTIDIKPVDWRD